MKTKLLLLLLLLIGVNSFAQTNLVQNGKLETWTNTTTPENWTVENTVTKTNAFYVNETTSAKLSITDKTLAPKILTKVPMTAGVTYTIKYKYKYVNTNYSGMHPITLNISQNGASNTLSNNTFATNNNWTQNEATFTADQNLSYDLSISLFSFDNLSFQVLIDDVKVYVKGTEEYTLIPDTNFEKRLIALGLDDVADGKVLTPDIMSVTQLSVSSNSISNLTGIEGFSSLTTLNCNFNNITALDLSKNPLLTTLSCRMNKLNTIDVSKNTLLTSLDVYSNNLNVLTLSANKALNYLDCSSNKLTALDISNNLNLLTLICSRNTLGALDITKHIALQNLECTYTGIQTLDVSNNSNLLTLTCDGNSIKTLDVRNSPNLTSLNCENNLLTTIDVTSNLALKYLNCGNNGSSGNKISTLDLSKNTSLTELMIRQLSTLSNIDVSKNVALKKIDSWLSNLQSLDVSNNVLLETLKFSQNKVTTLNLNTNKLLKELDCSSNLLTTLDLSNNKNLVNLNCFSNNLSSLNVQNGNNLNLISPSFKNNVNLNCIQVDDASYANTKWSTSKDESAYFSPINCASVINVPDPKFEDKLIALGIDKDGKNGIVSLSSINTITSLDLSNSSITDLTGIQGFTALVSLNSSSNLLKKLDLSKNTALSSLNCSNNPSLTCIQVADLTVAANWSTTKDAIASFSLDCNVYTLIPDSKFEEKLIALKIDRDGLNGKVKTESISGLLYLDVSYSLISNLTGIQDFISLQQLYAYNNNLTSIDISKNTNLTNVDLSSNKIAFVDLTNNVNLTNIDLGSNKITSIDLTKNINLKNVIVDNNQINNLDLTKNTKLTYLLASSNNLVALDVSKNTELGQIWCQNNQIRTLDFSQNAKLYQVLASNNKLVNLNIKNGANTLLVTTSGNNGGLNFTQNPDLKCIQVDNVTYSDTNWSTKKDASATYSSDACPVIIPYTLIPDSNFEDKLIALGIDKDGKNGKVATMSIAPLTTLNVSNSNITDLTGIEEFTSLSTFDCTNNLLKTINVSKNLALTNLNVSKNQLTILSVTQNLSLNTLNCSNNAITALDVSKNTLLSNLNCNSNSISVLNVSNNALLSNLDCNSNSISVLDVSRNTKLSILSCSFNKIINLDISKNLILKELECSNNNLYNLNLKNGNNSNMERVIFGNFTSNPNLTCIQVDNAAYSTSNWIAKDATANYSEDCVPFIKYTLIPDPNFEKKLISLGIDSGVVDGKVETSKIATLTSLYIYNCSISDLTGIQDFISLESLECGANKLTILDVSNNLNLKYLNCNSNAITNINLSKNIALEELNCNWNALTSLDISKNINLKKLDCYNNKLTSLDITNSLLLTDLSANYNEITAIDVSKNKSLINLYLTYNKLSDINLSQNTLLTKFTCYGNYLSTLDLSKNINLTSLSCGFNNFKQIDFSKNVNLKSLSISNSYTLDKLDLSNNINLEELYCNTSNFKYINLKNGKNTLLKTDKVDFKGNSRLSCIQVDDITYSTANWMTKKDATTSFNIECSYSLPSNNFTIETKGESCLGENNGEISIVAKTTQNYVATVNNKPYTFVNNSLKISNLTPGNYNISIAISDENYEQNFNVVIQKGATITGKSSVTSQKVDVEITDGTAPYTVFVNGVEKFETSDTAFSITAKGGGLLEVKTAKACEGVYTKNIEGLDIVLAAYPNPTSGSFAIELPGSNKEVIIEINALDGRVISNKKYTLENGTAQLTLENQPKGVYIAKIYLDTIKNVKIIKN
ncbi:T9SS type A sorting domain-containing protein [Flavobacterium sp.]|uniref:T9SS type A sorting domain-containing protein n=1 Tax=Flavobacterium sp. TaxID=239 RepID=UPI002C043612|nr:T9SS type A sorting domain-containing protein [Flavobacterium sp.]HSD08635.1 T9SS type A sorting domain-containing protein [Flavobacterium sp.]